MQFIDKNADYIWTAEGCPNNLNVLNLFTGPRNGIVVLNLFTGRRNGTVSCFPNVWITYSMLDLANSPLARHAF